MIINSGAKEAAVVVGDVDTSNSMRMNLTAQSYSLILENLYKDPLGAVLRELTTNAVEAHQMANTTDKKVAIQLPNLLNTDLIIRDFGTGLTDEEIEKYLNCLFSSSKGDDNNAMGGFGLGSKSPLALVDSFSLVSVKNGYQYDYMWIKEKGEIPTPIFQGKSKTTRENGITITVPLGSSAKVPLQNLQRHVAESANRQLFAFRKNVMFVEDASVTYSSLVDISSKIFTSTCVLDLPNISVYSDTQFTTNSNNYYYRQPTAKSYVQIGSVVYDYSFPNISFDKLASLFTNLKNFVVNIKAPIGSLDLPMSREEVNMTDQNKTIITKAVANAVTDIENHIKSLSFNSRTDSKGYYDQIKAYSASTSTTSLAFKLYPDIPHLLVQESETSALFKSLKAKLPATNTSMLSLDRYISATTNSPSFALLDAFKKFPADQIRFCELEGNGTRHDVKFVDHVSDKYTYVFTTLRLPGNTRYKDLYQYVQTLKPNTRVMLIQTPDIVDPTIHKVMSLHLQNLIDFYGAVGSCILPIIVEQVLKDYSKSLKTATTGTIMTTKEYCSGVRLITMDQLDTSALRGYCPAYNGQAHARSSSLSGTNFYKVLKKVDDKGKSISQGPEYISTKNAKIFLTISEDIPFSFKLVEPLTNLTKSIVDHSLKNSYIYKVPEKIFEATKKRLEDDGHTVYYVDTTDATKSKIYEVQLPSFKDLTDPLHSTFQNTSTVFLHAVFSPYFNTEGWRNNQTIVADRIKEVCSDIKLNYTGADKDLVVKIIDHVSPRFIQQVSNRNVTMNRADILSIDIQIYEDVKKHIKDFVLSTLKTKYVKDWTVNSYDFLEHRTYLHIITNTHYSTIGFKLT